VGPVSTCGRELLRGWWRTISLMLSFMTFTSVRSILDTPTYKTENFRSTSSACRPSSKRGEKFLRYHDAVSVVLWSIWAFEPVERISP
jgi:hypothetical protein